MAGTWKTFNAPNTSTGALLADIMILLTDGSVLIHNGYVSSLANAKQWVRLAPDQQGNYETGSWSSEIDMNNARQYFASGVLMDGRVYAIGGEYSDAGNDTPLGETFDPQTNKWSAITKPSTFDFVRGDAGSCVLADGRVLVGGASTTEPPSTWSKRTALWDPTDDSWIEAGLQFGAVSSTTKDDPPEEETWTLLPDGSVLANEVRNAPKAERYVPSLDKWVPSGSTTQNLVLGTLNGALVDEIGPAILLPNGKLFVVGGTGQTGIYTPNSDPTQPGTWVQGPAFPADTSANPNWPTLTSLDSPACLMPNGKVICVGGTTVPLSSGYFSQNVVFFEYDPSSNATTLPKLAAQPSIGSSTYTYQCWFLLLPSGKLLVSAQQNTLYLYTPDPADGALDPSWKPANITAPSTMILGHSYTISGTQLNGLSQAVSYGDDGEMATNFPIVQLTNTTTNTVRYLRSYNFSTMGVATGNTVPGDLQTATVDIPTNMQTGSWSLVVIANGIPSDPVTVQIAAQDCFFIVDNSTISKGQVDSWVKQTPSVPAIFDPAFYVVVEGFTPGDLGLNLNNPQLLAPPHIPSIPSPFSQMQIAFSGPLILENPSLPLSPAPQRFTFPFRLTFLDDSMFTSSARNVTLTATFNTGGITVSNHAIIQLTPNPNPFILHGDATQHPPMPWYLSVDLRVFQIQASPNAGMFEAQLPTTGTAQNIATGFIQSVINNLNADVGNARATFDALPQDEQSEVLQLLPNDPNSGNAVYNFAVARVRYRDNHQDAQNVRVFFRMWQAQQTNASYNTNTLYRRWPNNPNMQPIPLLGVQGDEIMTVPFFASPRVPVNQDLTQQTDSPNIQQVIHHDPNNGEVDRFFGCWLDINQPNDPRFPQRLVNVPVNGPFNTVSPLLPIQQLVRSAHQCLIAEVAFDPDPIPSNADPSTSDKLAQRNLAFVPAPNPGLIASRRVPQTFEIRPTPTPLLAGLKPDELMIEWGDTPSGSMAEIYLPAISANAILAEANTLYTTHNLSRLDAHTLRVPASGVTYIPIPQGQRANIDANFVGLLTIDLPDTIHKGESYDVVVRQITSAIDERPILTIEEATNKRPAASSKSFTWRHTLGVFRLTIPVSTKEQLLESEEQLLSVLRWIAEAMPTTDRWHKVFRRYLDQVAGRVSFMGGNPVEVLPSGTGIWKAPPHHGPEHHRHFTGKVEGLIYDRFGDFEGFLLETLEGESLRFESHESRVEMLVRHAWEDRLLVRVIVEHHRLHRVVSLVLLSWM